MTLQEALKVNGKARRPYYSAGLYVEFKTALMFDQQGRNIDLNASEYMAEDWEPYKVHCKHEPRQSGLIFFDCNKFWTDRFEFKCRYCNEPLKATGWELA